jgi:integrase
MKKRDEGSIFRHPDGKRWITRLQYVTKEGKRTSKKKTSKTYELAKDALTGLRDEIARELSDRKTFRDLDKFFRDKYVHPAKFVGGQKVSGFRQKLVAVEHYMDAALDYFGDQPIDEISFSDLQLYKESLESKPVKRKGEDTRRSVSDVNHFLKRLRRIFNVAVEQDWLEKNPFNRGSKLIQVSLEVERTKILTQDEEKRLLEACTGKGKHLRPIIIFAIETALRRGELQKLQWFDVDLNRRQLRVSSENSKTLKSRLVPLSARAIEILNEVKKSSPPGQSALVFNTGDFKRSFATACDKAKIDDLHFHDLRHTAITRWLEKGISPALAMKASGHSQMKTFLRYVNQSSDSVFDFALKLDRAVA